MNISTNEKYKIFKNNPDVLFSETDSDNEQEKKQLFIELNHNDNIDICEYAVKAIERGDDVFYINSILDNIISDLKLNMKSLFKYFRIINKLMQSDLLSFKQYTQIQSITIKQPIFAEEFMEYLMLSNELFVYQYIVEIIMNLNKLDNIEKHSRFLVMANSNIEQETICGINGLGRINYSDDNFDLLSKTLSCLDSLVKQENHLINGSVTNSFGLMHYIGDKAISRLINLSKRDDPFILMEIARFLCHEFEKIYKEIYFEKLLSSLIKVNSEYLGIIRYMDMLLYSMIKKGDNINLVINFLIKWMTTSDCKPDKIETLQLFKSTFSIIFSKLDILQEALLLLLNNDNVFAPRLAAHIISTNKHSKKQNIFFNIDSLLDIHETDIIYICHKILGYFIDAETILSLFYSLLIGKKENKNIVNFLSNCFIEYVGYNYPLTTIEYLEKIHNDKEIDITLRNIIDYILSKTKIFLKEKTNKQKLKELTPSRKDNNILRKEEWRINQKIDELTDEKSIFKQISSKSYMKYGIKFSYYMNGNITEPQQLKSLSVSMELPYSLLVDPVKFEEDGFNFRSFKRKE
jgi:hypothetical protein